jgi:L-ascorbate metabolism protein UlaG (beta-lactamase superfamily)
MKFDDYELKWMGHSGFFIDSGKKIYIDPYMIPDNAEKADVILITHSHYDHCSVADMLKVAKENSIIVIPAGCQSKITKFPFKVDMRIIEAGQEIVLDELKIAAVPAYNVHKSFHPKDEGWLGYVVKLDNLVIYHAGDSDLIPEMQKLTGFKQGKNTFVALLPVGGKFVMTNEEAAEAASLIKPDLAIPMHYGSVNGTAEDAQEFLKLCEEKGIKAEILEKN